MRIDGAIVVGRPRDHLGDPDPRRTARERGRRHGAEPGVRMGTTTALYHGSIVALRGTRLVVVMRSAHQRVHLPVNLRMEGRPRRRGRPRQRRRGRGLRSGWSFALVALVVAGCGTTHVADTKRAAPDVARRPAPREVAAPAPLSRTTVLAAGAPSREVASPSRISPRGGPEQRPCPPPLAAEADRVAGRRLQEPETPSSRPAIAE